MTATATRPISVKAAPKGCTPTNYQFSVAKPEGRAAKFLRDRYPVARAVSDTKAELADGGSLEVSGCTLYDLGYTVIPAAEPTPEPEPAELPALPSKTKLHKMDAEELVALAAARGVNLDGAKSKKAIIERLIG